MKTVIRPEFESGVLKEWRGAHAKVWMFHVTHNRLALRLDRTGSDEALYIVAIGCELITGPFSWKNANICLVSVNSTESGEYRSRIFDKQVGFELICSGVALVKAPIGEFDVTFEGFLGDAPG